MRNFFKVFSYLRVLGASWLATGIVCLHKSTSSSPPSPWQACRNLNNQETLKPNPLVLRRTLQPGENSPLFWDNCKNRLNQGLSPQSCVLNISCWWEIEFIKEDPWSLLFIFIGSFKEIDNTGWQLCICHIWMMSGYLVKSGMVQIFVNTATSTSK